ncbi:MAG TPA: hypothetical protein PKD09_09405 [Aggregatilinea sp.]|uniref:hypothetical protein n=1 Tax=Aggregatilinea sp. TaxID=2806333 RepID=UPI002BD25040|nr:hypothetical protein [Aggregatilinea sp.]HML21853.1 hypothetical protein [Aggregatilinea sp.]
MTCNGVVVTRATLALDDLDKHLESEALRNVLTEMLAAQGIEVQWSKWTFSGWKFRFNDAYIEFSFNGGEVKVTDQNYGQEQAKPGMKARIEKTQQVIALFAGQVMQGQAVKSFQAMGMNPRDVKALPDGALEFRIDLSAAPSHPNSLLRETARIQVGLDGVMKTITEDGGFDAGKKKLELILGMFGQQSGLNVTPSNEFESHRHEQDAARLTLNNGW